MNRKKLFRCLSFIVIALSIASCSEDHVAPGEFPPGEGGGETDSKDYVNNFYPNEVKPPKDYTVFKGAYYRKAASSVDVWTGIEGTIVLPTFQFDPNRVDPSKPLQYLDNPSVYMGGNMGGQETDIGLTWEVVKDENGVVSSEKKAFRPFMRRTKINNQESTYANAPAEAKYYWYPGETITMSVRIDSNGKLKFVVEGNGKRYETLFDAEGYTKGSKGTFKRVNAIDQVSNEGKPVQATKTQVINGQWTSSYLYRYVDNNDVKVPMHSGRYTDMRCPDSKYFKITMTESQAKMGAETITINGAGY